MQPAVFGVASNDPTSYYPPIMNKGRILIVDDQEEILESLGAVLADEGHEVLRARDGQEALHVFQSDSPDVVFLDIWIPGIDGMQTLKAIKKIDPHCSIIMMSGHGTIETAVKAIKLGATDYLEKPLNLEDVLHLVQKAILERTLADEGHSGNHAPGQLIGRSDKASSLRRAIKNAVKETGAVWLVGDKGTGKEFVARIIHQTEGKSRNSLVKVRCTDLNQENLGEVLLGKNNGSRRLPGKIQEAAGGTLLLIRVDRLEKSLRPMLAELLQNHLPRTAAGSRGIPSFRLISTSNIDPETLIHQEGFPQDLAATLASRIIRIPALRERSDDIPLYLEHFLGEAAEEFDRHITGIDDEAVARLLAYPWPGNVKELKIVIEHVVMTAPGPRITSNDLLIPGEGEIGAASLNRQEASRSWSAQAAPQPGYHRTAEGEASHEAPAVALPAPVPSGFRFQKTLQGRVVMYGQGLHSGNKTGLTLSPLPPGGGIVFGHITSGGTVPALLDNVESTGFSTSLKRNGLLARTIEHLMAVFHIYGLTNVLAKISGEVPIMDGSALEFCHLVESAEIITQEDTIEEIRIEEPIELPLGPDNGKSMRIEPADSLEVEYYMDYPPPVGKLHMSFSCKSPEDFKEQIAPARTFGFVKDMRMMDEMGLAGGGRLSNVVLIDDQKVINPPLRFPDEFVRHKILDIIGDFYLLGRPFVGKIIARQTGHTENIAMLKLVNDTLKIL